MHIENTPFGDRINLDIMSDELRKRTARHTDEIVADLISEDYRAFADYIQLSILDYTLDDSHTAIVCMQFMADLLLGFARKRLIDEGLLRVIEKTDPKTGETYKTFCRCENADMKFINDHMDFFDREILNEEDFDTAMKFVHLNEKINDTLDFTDCLIAVSNRLYCAMNDAAHAADIL